MDIKMTAYLTLLSDILVTIKSDLSKVKDIDNDKNTSALLCLYCTIYEDCFSCMVLLKEHLLTVVSHILRNMLEAFIDFINLDNDENYLSILELDYHRHRKRILKEGLFEDVSQLSKLIDNAKKNVAELECKGVEALTIRKKFERSGLENLYSEAYITLCGESHNNLAVLMARSYNTERDVFMLINERPIEDFEPHLDTIFFILDEATGIIYERMGIHNAILNEKLIQMKEYLSKNPFQPSN